MVERCRDPRTWSWAGELSGACGDLGTTLPLAFALVASSGFPLARLFFLWGLVYVATGAYYRVPVSVQPLKAMAVIAIAQRVDAGLLTTAAIAFGIVMLALAATGFIARLQRWFTPGLVGGIQLGIGLMLARAAVRLVLGSPLYLGATAHHPALGAILTTCVAAGLYVLERRTRQPLLLPLLVGSMAVSWFLGIKPQAIVTGALVTWSAPRWDAVPQALVLLLLPQLPLTLGNAVIAADDVCHHLWGLRAVKVRPTRLAVSIGVADVMIGLAGGFPVCHGAGGIAAHARFGGHTGRTTIVLGAVLVALALLPASSAMLGLVPVPVLGALLLLVSWQMLRLAGRVRTPRERAVVASTGLLSFGLGNLAYGLAGGVIVHLALTRWPRRRTPAR